MFEPGNDDRGEAMTLIEQVSARAGWRMVGSEFPRWENSNGDTAAWPDELTGDGLRDLHLRLLHAGCAVLAKQYGNDRKYWVWQIESTEGGEPLHDTIDDAVMRAYLETSNDEG